MTGKTTSFDWPKWDSEDLYWDKQHRIRAFRALQSWYRETHLKAAPGTHPYLPQSLAGNMLRPPDARANKNFLPGVAGYARQRADWLRDNEATPVYPRLDHNMLGSMPVCFNLFAPLRNNLDAATEVLREVLKRPLGKIVAIEVEVPPRPKRDYLDDNTAFDALVLYDKDGASGLLAIETKYTEPFSPVPSKAGKRVKARDKLETNKPYRDYSSEQYGWHPGAFETLAFSNTTNQLWRNAILALAVKMKGLAVEGVPEWAPGPIDEMGIVVVSARADKTATAATNAMNKAHTAEELVKHVTFNDIISRSLDVPELKPWAREFRRRYLDLSPVFESPHFADLQVDAELRRAP